MNNMQNIPLDEILLMSFKAADDGNEALAENLYNSFENAKDRALKIAERAVSSGDIKTVDIIISSFNKAKKVSEERVTNKQIKYNEDPRSSFDSSSEFKVPNFAQNNNDKEMEINEIAKNLLLEFGREKQKSNDNEELQISNIDKQSKKANSFELKKIDEDTVLKKYLVEEKFDVGAKRANKLLLKKPNSSYLYNYLGVCLANQKKFDEALINLDKSISLDKEAYDTKFNQSLIHLRLGNFKLGWELYKNGLEDNIREVFTPYFNEKTPLWDGKSFEGTLVIYGEQGIGDQFMFGTVIEDVIKFHQDIAVVVDKRLINLFKRTYPEIKVLSIDELDSFTFTKHISMAGLCNFFRDEKNKFKNGEIKNYKTSEEKNNQINTLLPKHNKLRIGISWLSFAKKNAKRRSLSNDEVSKIIDSSDNDFISLQYGNALKNIQEINEKSNNKFIEVPGIDLTNNIESLSSIIMNCDLVISIDNSTAHLAACLGKPVWILLPYYNDFRWMEKSEESIWYKNALLLRQNVKDDWSEAIQNIVSALDQ